MEYKLIAFSKVKLQLAIHDENLRRILITIKKRHPYDDWIVYHRATPYLRVEALDWIQKVYRRDDNILYIDAEINFTLYHIDRLLTELDITMPNLFPSCSLTILELMEFFHKSRSSIMKALHHMVLLHPAYKQYTNGKICIPPIASKWLMENYYKLFYSELLNAYKRKLQHDKETYTWKKNDETK